MTLEIQVKNCRKRRSCRYIDRHVRLTFPVCKEAINYVREHDGGFFSRNKCNITLSSPYFGLEYPRYRITLPLDRMTCTVLTTQKNASAYIDAITEFYSHLGLYGDPEWTLL